jgi:hypothetical protein
MSDRFVCTADTPWTKDKGRSVHPDAKSVGDQENGWPSGDTQDYECPNCGLRFTVELAQ